jgi:hypothetical protein
MTTRQTTSPDPVCYWCGIQIEAETTFRGYDPDDPIMFEFGGTVSAIICTPACPNRPPNAVVHQPNHLAHLVPA